VGTNTPHDSLNTDLRTLSRIVAERILDLIEPRATLNSLRLLKGGFTNFTHLIEATSRQGCIVRLGVHRYSDLYRDTASKARVEYQALRLLIANDIPVPAPLYLDDKGVVLGGPGIVMSFVEGSQVVCPASQKHWATQLAETLARVHTIKGDSIESAKFFDAESVVAPWLNSDEIPETSTSHPDGTAIWDVIQNLNNSASRVQL
jgi:aminoglycoside phosphotransferase (APT) family kinase protein